MLILQGQLFRPELSGNGTTDIGDEIAALMQVPSEWILYDSYSSDPSSIELKEIIFNNAINAFEKGISFLRQRIYRTLWTG